MSVKEKISGVFKLGKPKSLANNPINKNEYRESVYYFAKEKKNETFGNAGESHAIDVFSVLFEFAQKELRIFAHNLCSSVPNSEAYMNGLIAFLKKSGTSVRILLEESPDEESIEAKPIFQKLRSLIEEKCQIEIRQTSARAKYGDCEINFSTKDNESYRIEYDKDKRAARWNFNDTNVTKRLNFLFDQFFNTAIPVKL